MDFIEVVTEVQRGDLSPGCTPQTRSCQVSWAQIQAQALRPTCGHGSPHVASLGIVAWDSRSSPASSCVRLRGTHFKSLPIHMHVSCPFQGHRSGPDQEPLVPYHPATMGVSMAW